MTDSDVFLDDGESSSIPGKLAKLLVVAVGGGLTYVILQEVSEGFYLLFFGSLVASWLAYLLFGEAFDSEREWPWTVEALRGVLAFFAYSALAAGVILFFATIKNVINYLLPLASQDIADIRDITGWGVHLNK